MLMRKSENMSKNQKPNSELFRVQKVRSDVNVQLQINDNEIRDDPIRSGLIS